MKFIYRGVDDQGKPAEGATVALTPEEATALLEDQGISVTEIRPERVRSLIPRFGVSAEDIALFCEHLSALVKAEMPMTEAMESLAHDTANPILQSAVGRIVDGLANGEELNKLMERERGVFPPILPAMVKAGVASGDLSATLRLAANHNWRMDALKKNFVSAIAYPALVVLITVAVVSFIMIRVVPEFKAAYSDMGMNAPAITNIIFTLSDFFPYFALGGIGGLTLSALIIYVGRNMAPCVNLRQWLNFNTPLLGRIMRYSYLARFCNFMSLALKSGLTAPDALDLLGQLEQGSMTLKHASEMAEKMRNGIKLSDAMIPHMHHFPELLVWSVRSCEKSGRLVDAFTEAGAMYEDQAIRSSQLLATMLPPLCVLLTGVFVFIMVLALFILPFLSFFGGLN